MIPLKERSQLHHRYGGSANARHSQNKVGLAGQRFNRQRAHSLDHLGQRNRTEGAWDTRQQSRNRTGLVHGVIHKGMIHKQVSVQPSQCRAVCMTWCR